MRRRDPSTYNIQPPSPSSGRTCNVMTMFTDPFPNPGQPVSHLLPEQYPFDSHVSSHSARSSISSPSSVQLQYQTPSTAAPATSPVMSLPQFDQQQFPRQSLMPPDFSLSAAHSPVDGLLPPNQFDTSMAQLPDGAFDLANYSWDVNTSRRSSYPSIAVEPLTSAYINDMYRIDPNPPASMVAYPHHQQRGSPMSFNLAAGHSSTPSVSSSVGSSIAQLVGGEASPVISDCSDGEKQVRNLMRASPSRRIVTLVTPVPAQASMMGQFNSKVSSSAQKRHVCKVCDKRFTRPSSLQTHMYSHTGEKPYECEHSGCGRRFSVVSNLRRHKKTHENRERRKSASPAEVGSEAGSSASDF